MPHIDRKPSSSDIPDSLSRVWVTILLITIEKVSHVKNHTFFYFSYFIQLNAVKGPDASGPAYYNMSMANITMSPQCFGLGVENVSLDCWRHDLVKQPREMADCMGND